jgi:hypothetical protein
MAGSGSPRLASPVIFAVVVIVLAVLAITTYFISR